MRLHIHQVLARQHATNLGKLVDSLPDTAFGSGSAGGGGGQRPTVRLLTASSTPKERAEIKAVMGPPMGPGPAGLGAGGAHPPAPSVLIGTHALLFSEAFHRVRGSDAAAPLPRPVGVRRAPAYLF